MKIGCYCGASIVDQTDELPHKAHVIPDMGWLARWDAIHERVLRPLALGEIDERVAGLRAIKLLLLPGKYAYQCKVCGRLYVEGVDRALQCYVPMDDSTSKEVLREESPEEKGG